MNNISRSTQHFVQTPISQLLNEESIHLKVQPKESSGLVIFKYSIVVLGLLWGVPWIHSCYSALEAMEIYDYNTRVACGLIVFYSILTISIDGVWIMTSIYKVAFRHVKTNLELRQTYKYQRRFLIGSFFVGIISSVPGVYASYTFNTGLRKYLAIIILFGNVGLATYGFYSLVFEIWDRLKSGVNDSGKVFLQSIQRKYYRLLQHYNKNKEYDSRLYNGDYKDLCQFVEIVNAQYALKINEAEEGQTMDCFFKFIPNVFGGIISASQSLIDVILIYNLLTSLSFPSVLAYCLSSIMTIPNLFVSFISSREVMTKIIVIIRCSPSPRLNHCRNIPFMTFIVSILGLLAFFSPLAGCYITYTTLSESNINMGIVISAVVTIFIARFCFSNFTLRLVIKDFFAKKMNRWGKDEEDRVNRMFQLIRKVSPKYFQSE